MSAFTSSLSFSFARRLFKHVLKPSNAALYGLLSFTIQDDFITDRSLTKKMQLWSYRKICQFDQDEGYGTHRIANQVVEDHIQRGTFLEFPPHSIILTRPPDEIVRYHRERHAARQKLYDQLQNRSPWGIARADERWMMSTLGSEPTWLQRGILWLRGVNVQ